MNALIEQINSTGKTFIDFALPMLIQSSVLIIILLALDMLLRKRIRAVFRYWIWMIVLVKLILPPSLSLPTSPAYWFGDKIINSAQNTPMQEEPVTYSFSNLEIALPSNDFTPTVYKPESVFNSEEPVATPPVIPKTHFSWQAIAFLSWLTLSLIMFILLIQRTFFVKRLINQSQKADEKLNNILEQARLQMSLKKKVVMRLSDTAMSPSVCGLFKPVILIPQKLVKTISSNDLKAILLHELAHIKRNDLWVNLVQAILQIIYIYNPLLWIANIMIRNIREQAVDEMVLVAMGEHAEEYPKTLLNISRLSFGSAALSLRLIGVAESKKALITRIKHITSRPFPSKAKLGVLGMIVVIALSVILLPMAKSERALASQTDSTNIPDQQQRIYELIYILRHYTIDIETEQWAGAIKELTEIGSDAVPELVKELNNTQSGKYIRVLAFTLRAIGDPLAVPALINVLPISTHRGSDSGIGISDPNLLEFMAANQSFPEQTAFARQFSVFMFNRPVTEVTMALEKITGHSEVKEQIYIYDSNDNKINITYESTPELEEIQKRHRTEAANKWQIWWDEHWSEFVTQEQLANIYKIPLLDEDVIENVGLKKFGQPFPTGKDITLSPVIETILPVLIHFDSKSFLDLDTGMRFSNLEGAAPENRSNFTNWYKQVGVDIAGNEIQLIDHSKYNGLYNCGMKTWQIDNSRWDTIEKEIKSGKPLEFGTIGPRSDFYYINPQTRDIEHKKRPATFLFHTLHGTSGILQITDPIDDPNGTHIKYRLIESPAQSIHKQFQKPVIYTTEYSEEGILGSVIEKVVYKSTSDIDSVLDLDTGKSSSIPEDMRGPSYPAELFEWMESEGYDVCILVSTHPDGKVDTLTTCKVASISVSPELWNTITPKQLKDLIWKVDVPERYSVQGGMYVGGGTIPKTYPVVFGFKTNQGAMGILQITSQTDDKQGLNISYRLLQEN